jgi:hypothetical protein
MDEQKMTEAWEMFDKAASLDAKRVSAEAEGNDNKARIARSAADRNLDKAVALEAEALAA